jgi:hypothetical protein
MIWSSSSSSTKPVFLKPVDGAIPCEHFMLFPSLSSQNHMDLIRAYFSILIFFSYIAWIVIMVVGHGIMSHYDQARTAFLQFLNYFT